VKKLLFAIILGLLLYIGTPQPSYKDGKEYIEDHYEYAYNVLLVENSGNDFLYKVYIQNNFERLIGVRCETFLLSINCEFYRGV